MLCPEILSRCKNEPDSRASREPLLTSLATNRLSDSLQLGDLRFLVIEQTAFLDNSCGFLG